MSILTREEVELASNSHLHAMDGSLRDTARAYHVLRDAVLALHYAEWDNFDSTAYCELCCDEWPCATARACGVTE